MGSPIRTIIWIATALIVSTPSAHAASFDVYRSACLDTGADISRIRSASSVWSPLSDAERRHQGFVFFETPKKEPVESPKGLVLSIDGLPQPAQIPLN